ncbi:MAG: quinolinate synthase NadA [Frisingicoccus sp.]|nr:quinolinate synthase NadA [Frisingicoccus sp.]
MIIRWLNRQIIIELQQKNPDKKFYSVGHRQFCPNMKRISIDNVLCVLENPVEEIILSDSIMEQARKPLVKMLDLAK